MITDSVSCTIERRLLVNYRIDPEIVATQLPPPFRPQLVAGWAVGGICFIRLGNLRVPGLPRAWGVTTENAAHRFAVEWEDDEGATRAGVYVPRRDTNSRMVAWAGGRVFSGHYRPARFAVQEEGPGVRIDVSSRDGRVHMRVAAHEQDRLDSVLFGSTEAAMAFFRSGSLGYSPDRAGSCLDGVYLDSPRWDARPAAVEHITSSVFDDRSLYPPGTCQLDSGLVMRDLPVRWVVGDAIGVDRGAPAAA